jgi:hypothetical protein
MSSMELQEWLRHQTEYIEIYKKGKVPPQEYVHGCITRTFCNFFCLPLMCFPCAAYSCACRIVTCSPTGNDCTDGSDKYITDSFESVNEQKKDIYAWMRSCSDADRVHILNVIVQYNNLLSTTSDPVIDLALSIRIIEIYEHINKHNRNVLQLRQLQTERNYKMFVATVYTYYLNDLSEYAKTQDNCVIPTIQPSSMIIN